MFPVPRLLMLLLGVCVLNLSRAQPEAFDVWTHTREGNNFDGFRLAAGIVTQEDNALFLLKVYNLSGSLETLDESSSSLDDLFFQIRGSFDFEPHSLLMSFDDSEQVWEAPKVYFGDPDRNGLRQLAWRNFISRDSKSIMPCFEFVRQLKQRHVVHFRIQGRGDLHTDVSFSLAGSSAAINNCVSVPAKESGNGDWPNSSIDYIAALLNWTGLKPASMRSSDYGLLFDYLDQKRGGFFFLRIGRIELVEDIVILKNHQDQDLLNLRLSEFVK